MTKTRQWAVLTLVAVLVVLAGGWMLLVSPQRSKVNDLNGQASAAQQRASELHAQLANLLAQKRNLPEQQRILARVATKIPADPAEPTLIRELQAAAHTAGVDLSQLNPSTPTQVTTTTSAPTTVGAAATSGATAALPLYQVPVTLTVIGSYFNVEMFEHSIEQLPRAMLVSGFTMSPESASGSGSGSQTAPANPGDVTATITASVFLSPRDAASLPTAPTTGSGSTTSAGSNAS